MVSKLQGFNRGLHYFEIARIRDLQVRQYLYVIAHGHGHGNGKHIFVWYCAVW